ncbi:MAG TPA: GAP family protein [Trebonia sp.]|nr:GAP family protein [Trebonia sp.]
MLAQAAGFAVLAAISPTALLVMAVFLGSDNPRRIAGLYTLGAVIMTVVMAVTVLLVIEATGLNQPRQQEPRYGLRLGLGILALLFAVVMIMRARRAPAAVGVTPRPAPAAMEGAAVTGAPRPAPTVEAPTVEAGTVEAGTAGGGIVAEPASVKDKERKPGLLARLTASPRPLTAFLAGLILFAPSATFIAAVQVIATSNADISLVALAMLIVIVLTALTVWLPLIAYFAAPEATTRALRNANAWLVANGKMLVVSALLIAGVALVVNGALNV